MCEEADMGVTQNYSQIDVSLLPVMILDVEVKLVYEHAPAARPCFALTLRFVVRLCFLPYLQTKMEECGEMSPALPLSHGPTPSQTALQHPQLMLTGSQLAGVSKATSERAPALLRLTPPCGAKM